jgi:hypothetical protein
MTYPTHAQLGICLARTRQNMKAQDFRLLRQCQWLGLTMFADKNTPEMLARVKTFADDTRADLTAIGHLRNSYTQKGQSDYGLLRTQEDLAKLLASLEKLEADMRPRRKLFGFSEGAKRQGTTAF